uniref:Flavin-containing monooxygenase n=1 Tax=Ditylenchus dipsaci TaxID=166011 RepID=A0A915D4G8_9BILA
MVGKSRFHTYILNRLLPGWVLESMIRRRLHTRFDHTKYGLLPEHSVFVRPMESTTVNDELPCRIMCGEVQMKPGIEKFTKHGVIFTLYTNNEVEVDNVILATGFNLHFNQLIEGGHLFAHSSLGVIGLIQPTGAIISTSEMQARFFFHLFSSRHQEKSNVPYVYRLAGPHAWPGARQAILTVDSRVDEPFKTRMCTVKPKKANCLSYDGADPNRGEIALRVMRTAKKMGVKTVVVYSDVDARSQHVIEALSSANCSAWRIGEAAPLTSYLDANKILQVAKQSGAQAIHPGYGFLSENAGFAEMCHSQNIKFIGPSAQAIRVMGQKNKAKDIMIKANVPVLVGYNGEEQIMIKPVCGGGGRGMRIVNSVDEFFGSVASSISESNNAFGNSDMIIEKYIKNPRHVEVQVFGDSHGNYVHCGTEIVAFKDGTRK